MRRRRGRIRPCCCGSISFLPRRPLFAAIKSSFSSLGLVLLWWWWWWWWWCILGNSSGAAALMMGGGGPNGNMQGPADDARVEGCFNHFDAQAEVPLDPSIVGVHNNLRCQAACATQGYALAATRSNPLGCLCGNDYPSPFHQMDAAKCDAPCSPDRASCFLFTCCGSQDGKLFIVSFTGKQNIMLQVLRQLAFDYRHTSPTFRNKIEGDFVDASPLQVSDINDNNEAMFMVAGGGGGGNGNGNGLLCPSPWLTFQNACYRLHWAQPLDFDAAQHVCQAEDGGGACLVVPESAQENEIVAQLQAGCQGWLGIRRSPPGQEKGYQNWTTAAAAATPSSTSTSECAQLRPDGGWVSRPCKLHDQDNDDDDEDYESRYGGSCFICKRMLLTAADNQNMEAVSLVPSSSHPSSETWRLLPVPDPDPDHFVVQIQHEPSHQLLACSPEHGGLELVPPSNDPATCTRSTFVAEVNEENGCFTLRQQSRVVAVVENDRGGGSGGGRRRLLCMEQQDQQQQQTRNGAAAATFRPTCMLRVFAQRYLRLSVVTLSQDLHHRGQRECSVAAHDTSPTTTSYRCRPLSGESRVGAAAQGDELWLEQQALLIGDESRWLRPRVPLPLGRLRCINGHPTQSAICTIAYGQGVTIARALTVDWNYLIFDTITARKNVEARLTTLFRTPRRSGGGGGAPANAPLDLAAIGDVAEIGDENAGDEGDGEDQGTDFTTSVSALKELTNDFTALYNNIYEIAVIHAYVETRNWQMTLLAKPLTSYSIQFWLETVYLTYRWRALFQARGSFRVFYFDQPIGSHHAIGDLSNYDDIFFYVFGRYDFPLEGSLIATVNNRGEERWPLALATTSVVEDDRGGGF